MTDWLVISLANDTVHVKIPVPKGQSVRKFTVVTNVQIVAAQTANSYRIWVLRNTNCCLQFVGQNIFKGE